MEWEGNQKKFSELWRWISENPCQHNSLTICDEWVANAGGMSSFRFICRKLGEQNFPILNTYLPTSNDGFLPAQYAPQLLEELHKMCNLEMEETTIELMEINRNHLVYSTNQDQVSRFIFGGNSPYNCYLSKDGFLVMKYYKFGKYTFRRRVWQSKSFIQEKDERGHFYFKDKNSNRRINLNINLIPLERENNQFFEFKVIEKRVTVLDEYGYAIRPLLKLAEASIETGNNICWT
ncbi:MAG TPA: hypothetical protein VK168_07515 [Saprospiraceae bacterium]|nr:hypothetical protein [Saprospiraceae bacterium]